ncbi:MAG: anthrone oxygenase family protein [Planctomycetota bacterium]
MQLLVELFAFVALLGSGLIAGAFFAFSSFVMGALAKLGPERGAEAMRSINIVVINPLFLGVFMGTTILSLVLVALSLLSMVGIVGVSPVTGAIWYAAGGGLYFVGTFLVTGLGNVPLNNELAKSTPGTEEDKRVWAKYLSRWTRLNTIRTIAALAAVGAIAWGLAQSPT